MSEMQVVLPDAELGTAKQIHGILERMTLEQQKSVLAFLKGMELGERYEKDNHLHGNSKRRL